MQLVMYSLNSAVDSTYLRELAMLISNEVTRIRRWIEQHISDSSAVHYLVTLLDHLNDEGLMDVLPFAPPLAKEQPMPEVGEAPIRAENLSSSTSHAMSLVQSYPDHESLWLYFRAVSCQEQAQSDAIQTFSRSFIFPWARQTLLPYGFDSKLVAIYAYRYIARKACQVGTSL
jgi:protein prenyltransferase alpha subunit repeat containing protein 1